MKFLFLSMAVSIGVLFYISGGKGPAALKTFTQSPARPDEAAEEIEAPEERMVQIQGQWYKYRADNRYVIDGVPTFHVPAKLKPKEKPARIAAAAPAALIKMAGENPLKVYTPEGFKALNDGLDTVKNSAAEKNKALEDLVREP